MGHAPRRELLKASRTMATKHWDKRGSPMPVEITDFDPAAHRDDDEAIAAYLSDAFETQDVAFISDAIGVVARAKGMKQIAQEAGVSRESLYRALSSSGNPELGTVLKVLASMNIRISAQPGLKSA